MENNYRDNYYGSILDPLHGDIKLSEVEKWCISQPIFSRLRRVKQNTFLYYVFPSANHTRFEHSIGVMHLAGKIFDSCKENFATGQKKKEKYTVSGDSSFFNLNELGDREEIYYQELRLAALLHDLGHGPLSHLFDEFAISDVQFLNIISSDDLLNRYEYGFKRLIEANNNKVEHEIISCAFIFKLIDQLKKENINNPNKFSNSAKNIIEALDVERVVKLVEPEFEGLPDFIDNNQINYTSFLSRIITGFPIDADRMDYLWRDSYFSGVTYGIYDINRIFASFLATMSEKVVSLTYKESGLDSMLRFIQSRSHLYNQVYFHKTNRAANTMLSFSTTSKRKSKLKLLDQCQNMEALTDFYVTNGDDYFLTKTAYDHLVGSSLERNVLNDLLNRKLFKRVFQAKIVLTKAEFNLINNLKEIKKSIDHKLNSLQQDNIIAISDMYENKTFKDSDLKPILIAKKSGKKYDFTSEWNSISREFELADMNVSMIRVYLKRTFQSSDEFEKMRMKIMEILKNEISELRKFSS